MVLIVVEALNLQHSLGMHNLDVNAHVCFGKMVSARFQEVRRRCHMRHCTRAEEDVVDAVEDGAVAGLAKKHLPDFMLYVYPVSRVANPQSLTKRALDLWAKNSVRRLYSHQGSIDCWLLLSGAAKIVATASYNFE
jgi:hypothetical protein